MACRRVSLLASISLGLLLFAGCESTAIPKPTGTTTVTLREDSRRGNLNIKAGVEVVLELPLPKAEGHRWIIVQNDPRYFMPLGDIGPQAADTGRSVVRFQALQPTPRRMPLKFAAVPANAKEAKHGDTYDIAVTIQPP